jgi:hypothetical protein
MHGDTEHTYNLPVRNFIQLCCAAAVATAVAAAAAAEGAVPKDGLGHCASPWMVVQPLHPCMPDANVPQWWQPLLDIARHLQEIKQGLQQPVHLARLVLVQ